MRSFRDGAGLGKGAWHVLSPLHVHYLGLHPLMTDDEA